MVFTVYPPEERRENGGVCVTTHLSTEDPAVGELRSGDCKGAVSAA